MGPETTHLVHIVAWSLGAVDVILVAATLFFSSH